MNRNDPSQFDVEHLLEEVQFSPNPSFQEKLRAQLKQQLLNQSVEQDIKSAARSEDGRSRRAWRWAFRGAAAACLFLVLLIGLVPSVQAQVIALLRHFGVPLPAASEGLVISPFTPLAPDEVPEQFIYFASLHMNTEAGDYVELRYYGQDAFMLIFEAPAQDADALPQGEPMQVGGYEAVLEQIPSGMVLLAAQAPQPWRLPGNGGGGGGGDSDSGSTAPQQLAYTAGTKLSWVQDGIYIELLTNLPQDEALRLAASLRPCPQLATP